ncbi:MAG: sulfite exporter TauE/SafE family protein [Gammaproteobacteria bacterium]|nr:sulfite exporter TauE/SafE family protein [Gammaproteobacteria bacterium]
MVPSRAANLFAMPGLPDITLALYLALLGIVLFAGLVHGTLGLGFPMVATPLLALLTDVRSAILITLLPTVVVNVVSIARGGRWRDSVGRYWPLAVFVAVGSLAGASLLVTGDPDPFRLVLAGLVLLYLNVERFAAIDLGWMVRRRWVAMVVFGTVAGFMGGAANVMVPVLIIMFLQLQADTRATVQVFNMCFLTAKLVQIGVFGQAGLLTPGAMATTGPLALAALAALLGGMALRDRISAMTYRRWLRRLLAVMATVLILQYVASVY